MSPQEKDPLFATVQLTLPTLQIQRKEKSFSGRRGNPSVRDIKIRFESAGTILFPSISISGGRIRSKTFYEYLLSFRSPKAHQGNQDNPPDRSWVEVSYHQWR